jgi:hypothetical protein
MTFRICRFLHLLTYTTKAIASSLDTHIEFLSLSAEDIIDRYTGNGM